MGGNDFLNLLRKVVGGASSSWYNRPMVIVGIIGWWYGRGLRLQIERLLNRVMSVYDYFSIDLLLRTLFAPFRQISAGHVRGPLAVQLRALGDRLFSRLIGAAVRCIMIVIGAAACIVILVIALLGLVLWLVAPVLPVVGFIISLTGWVPWRL